MTDSEYTPTTEQVRIAFGYESMYAKQTGEDFAAFDRWLLEHDRVVAAQAWDEAAEIDAGCHDCIALNGVTNPYRTEESN